MEIYLEDLILLILGGSALLSTFIQISPIKVNPWSALFRWIGGALTKDVREDVAALHGSVEKVQEALEEHIRIDDMRTADEYRRKILAFNTQLLRGIQHTKEDFTEIFGIIDAYEKYCNEHPGYKNHRATHAVKHIGDVYDDLLEKRNFLKE